MRGPAIAGDAGPLPQDRTATRRAATIRPEHDLAQQRQARLEIRARLLLVRRPTGVRIIRLDRPGSATSTSVSSERLPGRVTDSRDSHARAEGARDDRPDRPSLSSSRRRTLRSAAPRSRGTRSTTRAPRLGPIGDASARAARRRSSAALANDRPAASRGSCKMIASSRRAIGCVA